MGWDQDRVVRDGMEWWNGLGWGGMGWDEVRWGGVGGVGWDVMRWGGVGGVGWDAMRWLGIARAEMGWRSVWGVVWYGELGSRGEVGMSGTGCGAVVRGRTGRGAVGSARHL